LQAPVDTRDDDPFWSNLGCARMKDVTETPATILGVEPMRVLRVRLGHAVSTLRCVIALLPASVAVCDSCVRSVRASLSISAYLRFLWVTGVTIGVLSSAETGPRNPLIPELFPKKLLSLGDQRSISNGFKWIQKFIHNFK
jgi:hypothetical protein